MSSPVATTRAAAIDVTGIGRARRVLDVSASAVALVLLAPLLAAVALAVRLDSPGPVLYRQQRVGEGRRPFTLLKFRSMRAGGAGGPEVTAPGDARITRLGALLRRTSLDELPQLLNVLLGQMTLVGPRPETPRLAAGYPASLGWVLEHRPGLTGPAQVRLRDAAAIPADVQDAEAYYLERLVPLRVALDAGFLSCPTLGATLGVVGETARHLLGAARPEPGTAPAR